MRIRFYNNDISKQDLLIKTFSNFHENEFNKNIIHRISIDTYIRELNRYSIKYMEFSESIFFFDSITVLKILNLFESNLDEKYRILFAIKCIDEFLNDFNYDINLKIIFINSIRISFFNEFGGSAYLQKYLNSKYRELQTDIFFIMNDNNNNNALINTLSAILKERSTLNRSCILENEINIKNIENILPSYIHMSMNRIFLSNARKYELVTYHFLHKYLCSKLALLKTANL